MVTYRGSLKLSCIETAQCSAIEAVSGDNNTCSTTLNMQSYSYRHIQQIMLAWSFNETFQKGIRVLPAS